jgi:alpha-beta hydrolase superfamily lysophospholipase
MQFWTQYSTCAIMGCNTSTAVQYAEITDLCQCPGVLFHEEIQVLNNASRNVASWLPELEPVKAAVIISHGLNEHILRYYGIATELAKHGFAVYGIDHVSHGKSTGKRGVIPDCTVMYRDFIAFGTSINEKHPTVPLFMLAHSMGTLVGMMSINSIPQLKAAVLSGPAVIAGPGSSSPFGMRCLYPLSQTSFAICLTSVTSAVDPRGAAAPLVLEEITSDPDELERIRKDPRLAPPIVTNKSAYEVVKLINATKAEIPNIMVL